LVQTAVLPRVFIAGEAAVVQSSAMAPGDAGVWLITAQVPDLAPTTGQVPVVVIAPGGYASNAVTIWVQ